MDTDSKNSKASIMSRTRKAISTSETSVNVFVAVQFICTMEAPRTVFDDSHKLNAVSQPADVDMFM
jgi:hypothetical protein